MLKYLAAIGIGALVLPAPAAAEHLFNLGDPYASRGECESTVVEFDQFDRESLQIRFPQLFSSSGDARSFIARAFTCEFNHEDGNWYITDHLNDVLNSDWFLRRQ